VLTILLGPFLALFPKRWRDSLPPFLSPAWRLATILSGFAEGVFALFAMLEWYSYSMATWVSRAMASATSGNLPREANEQEIGFAAISIFAMHPWTWAIGYCAVEGTVRLLSAAFSESIFGILPLYLVDKVLAKSTGRQTVKSTDSPDAAQGHLSSFAGSIRQKVLTATLPELPDEHWVKRAGDEETLEIRATRPKAQWVPPGIVCYGDAYYRLEAAATGAASRPFVYTLRRLPAGVPGRSVLIYKPASTPIEIKWSK
jgi:hypothetical protein